MDEKSNSSSSKKEENSGDRQGEGNSGKITNFFPVLRTEGRAKMCASKSDDSKQKEMVKKMKRGKESMTLRSKKQDKPNDNKSSGSTANQGKEKIRNVAVASASEKSSGSPASQGKEKIRNVAVASASEKSCGSPASQGKEKIRNVAVASASEKSCGSPASQGKEKIRNVAVASASEKSSGSPASQGKEKIRNVAVASASEKSNGSPASQGKEKIRNVAVASASEKSNGSPANQGKEKIRNVTVASALKTPLGQVLRKSIEASDKREAVVKSNQTKTPETVSKTPVPESKKNLSDSESIRILRQKIVEVPEKLPVRPYKRRTVSSDTPASAEKPKMEEVQRPHRSPGRPPKVAYKPGRPPKVAYTQDTVTEDGKTENLLNKKKTYRKRHFRGSTYGLYLTPARKKKKKLQSSQDESKDEEGSVTSTENNSFLDSEDGNSFVSNDFFTTSEKSLADEEQGLESQSSSILSSSKKSEKSVTNFTECEESSLSKNTVKEEKPEPKVEISADYEENTQNVTDLFQDLEDMQWESDQKSEKAENVNSSQSSKLPQYDDISNESFTNTLHFSFKKNAEDSEDNFLADNLISGKSGVSTCVSSGSNCDVTDKPNEKIDLPEISETSFSINDMFDEKDDSNVGIKEDADVKDALNSAMKEDSNAAVKNESNANVKEDSISVLKESPDEVVKDDSNASLKGNLNVFKDDSNASQKDNLNALKDDMNAEMKDESFTDMKDCSDVKTKDNIDSDMKDCSAANTKDDTDAEMINRSEADMKNNSNQGKDDDSKKDPNSDLKDDTKVDIQNDSNLVSTSSEDKMDLQLIASNMSDKDLNLLTSEDILSSKDDLNLLFEDVDDDKNDTASDVIENKETDLDSFNLPEKEDSNLPSQVISESRESSNQMECDVNEKKSVESPLVLPESEEINNSNSLLINDIKQDSNSVHFTDLNKQDSNSQTFTVENKTESNSIAGPDENSKPDSFSTSFSDKSKLDSSFESFSNEIKQISDSLSSPKEEKETSDIQEKNESELSNLDKNESDAMFDNQNKAVNNFHPSMEVDNSDEDDQSIANCVKSRQRIKRRFTDDVVDTDLGILSVAAMDDVKKARPETPKDVVENFQSVIRTEPKKNAVAAKIEVVFNYKQSPIKSCCCDSDAYQAKSDETDEVAFCQAVDSIDDKLLGCTNPIVTRRLVRTSVKHPFSLMCETHLWRLKHHHACPYCGLFCSQGPFMQCTNGDKPYSVHLFHEQCQSKEEGAVPFCFHCGSSSSLKRVHLEIHMANPPAFFLNQNSKVSVPDVSKARISFSESSDFCKKEDEEPALSYKIEESGKILSSAGLPNESSKEELEKLISMLNDENLRSFNCELDEFYNLAASGDVLKVLYMLVKGFDPNERFASHEGETALHAAAANGHVTVVHLLIQAGAVNDSLNEKMSTPLMLAVENGHKEVVHYLVKKGAITDFKGENGMSSLHLAAKSGDLDILKILMSSRDTDIDAQDDGGWTPIVWASEHDHLDVVKYLLKRGANPNIPDNEGNIGLHWSAFSGSVEISYLYLDYGCDINSVNELGDTPLHIAARQDSFPCVTLFLSRGADVTILNKAEKLPAECCLDKNSDTYLSLSLNMLLKKITKKYQHKAEKIIHRDISRGKEQIAIQCVNAYDDEMPPLDFLYVTENCETMPIKIDRTITSLQACHCEDDCSTASCSCASISYQCWYDKEGLLLPEFNLLDPPMLFECNRACSCWSLNCQNRVLQNGITCRLQLIRTNGKGWGVRTLKDIPKGAFICEYVGELISDSAADKRADDSYLFDLDNRDGETYCLDARYYGNISRFINHLCEPNLVPVKIYVDHQDLNFPRIAFFSSRDIKQYEELGFDYGEKFWAIKYKQFTCECGTPKCKYSKDVIHTTMANYYRRLKEEQMEEAAAASQQTQVEIPVL